MKRESLKHTKGLVLTGLDGKREKSLVSFLRYLRGVVLEMRNTVERKVWRMIIGDFEFEMLK